MNETARTSLSELEKSTLRMISRREGGYWLHDPPPAGSPIARLLEYGLLEGRDQRAAGTTYAVPEPEKARVERMVR